MGWVISFSAMPGQLYSGGDTLEILSVSNPSQAINELLENVREYEMANDHVRLALSHSSIAFIYIKQEDLEQAKHHINTALNLFSEEEANKYPQLAFVYQVYARFLLSINKLD